MNFLSHPFLLHVQQIPNATFILLYLYINITHILIRFFLIKKDPIHNNVLNVKRFCNCSMWLATLHVGVVVHGVACSPQNIDVSGWTMGLSNIGKLLLLPVLVPGHISLSYDLLCSVGH